MATVNLPKLADCSCKKPSTIQNRAPYSCPYSLHGCTFFGSPVDLYHHLQTAHTKHEVQFIPKSTFSIKKDVRFVHFLDESDDKKGAVVFVLDTRSMEIYSVQDPKFGSEAPSFPYSLAGETASRRFVFQPKTVKCRFANDAVWNRPLVETDRSANAVLLHHLFRDENRITLELFAYSCN